MAQGNLREVNQDLEGILVVVPYATHVKGKVHARSGVRIGYDCVIDGEVTSEGWVEGSYLCEYRNGIVAGSWVKLGHNSKVRGGIKGNPRSYVEIGHSSKIEGPIKIGELRLEHSVEINGRYAEKPREHTSTPYGGALSDEVLIAAWWFL